MEIVANIPVSGIPSLNEMLDKTRYSRWEAAKVEKQLRKGGHDAALYWMQQTAVPPVEIAYYRLNRTGHVKGKVENVLRATGPIFTLPVKLLLRVAPDRDIDGYFIKPILDGFGDAHLFEDDWLIDELTFRRDYSLEETNTVVFQLIQPAIDFETELAWAVFRDRFFKLRSKVVG
jgi:hypothetical protein